MLDNDSKKQSNDKEKQSNLTKDVKKEDGVKGKFEHSVKVPQLYKEAKKILVQYEEKKGALKTLVYNGRYRNYKAIYGLLSKVIDNVATIKTSIAVSKLLVEQPQFDPHLAQLFTAQLLAKGPLQGDCKPILIFKEYEEKIKEVAEKGFENKGGQKKNDGLPRYVRVNTLVGALSRVHVQLASDGYILQEYNADDVTYEDFLQLVNDLVSPYYLLDYHVPNLLVFPPGTEFWRSVLYKENVIILQDKASCLPVYLSSVDEGAGVIDACAAPGNKTSLIAAKMNNKGKIVAIERDPGRFNTMVKLLRKRQATCVKFLHSNFLKIKPQKYFHVEYIFLDPSCSSSGTNVHEDEVSAERLSRLASVQASLLSHALSFPSVKEVLYSTCSIYEEENEVVVGDMLEKHKDFELEDLGEWHEIWKHFGLPKYSFGHKCLRTNPEIDRCAGFFVAKFVRKNKSTGKKRKASESYSCEENEKEDDEDEVSSEFHNSEENEKEDDEDEVSSEIYNSEENKVQKDKVESEPTPKKSKKKKSS